METLTYRIYLADPTVREQIDREVRRLQREAVDQYIVAPIRNAWRRMFRPGRVGQAPVLAPSRRIAIAATVDQGDVLRIEDAEGVEIKLTNGRLWITQQDDTRDYVLDPHQVFRVKRNGTTLVHAMKRASLHIACRLEAADPGMIGAGVS